jgi:hypothetical protein
MYTMCFAANAIEILLLCACLVKGLSNLLIEAMRFGERDARHKGLPNGSLQVTTVADMLNGASFLQIGSSQGRYFCMLAGRSWTAIMPSPFDRLTCHFEHSRPGHGVVPEAVPEAETDMDQTTGSETPRVIHVSLEYSCGVGVLGSGEATRTPRFLRKPRSHQHSPRNMPFLPTLSARHLVLCTRLSFPKSECW